MERCAQCGFTYDDLGVGEIAGTIRAFGPTYRAALAGVDDGVARTRPAPAVWSALEYACHVRDVLLVQRDRALLALVEEQPSFARMNREERVALAHYNAHPPAQVAEQLSMAADLCAAVFEGLTDDQLARRLIYNFPAPTERTMAWLGRHTVHEGEHHLGDVRSVISQVEVFKE